jgi:hypothetical protein
MKFQTYPTNMNSDYNRLSKFQSKFQAFALKLRTNTLPTEKFLLKQMDFIPKICTICEDIGKNTIQEIESREHLSLHRDTDIIWKKYYTFERGKKRYSQAQKINRTLQDNPRNIQRDNTQRNRRHHRSSNASD